MRLLKLSSMGAALLLMVASCGPSTKMVGTWKPETASENLPYKKVFILPMTENIRAKAAFENSVAEQLKRSGVDTELSSTHYPPEFVASSAQDRLNLVAKMKELGCDAVLVMSLLDSQTETRHVQGNTYPAGAYGYYGGFGTYYGYRYGMVYDPGYYVEDKIYFLEANVYDVASESLQWSGQSKTYNPSDLESFSTGYAEILVMQLLRNNIIAE
ncbi:MAG: hypothetical protein EP346_05075 [Bacteroidetes bacterium]|uniref:DUF4136 domain-containing protein n=1 Tax=Phaeocystidibacter marisrubri TaxID=1577780 RepID=A0A6L3ZI87_9FLAO|nr:hypothetical protein [Phaeocystidibacter marisrubri]KAB2817319.1 hypothetical protein F8C82_02705 [Phaeocystidibacter marisrubri]TNE29820.1 MAG: hypothetical protein EP346_05075 [Bacteroidota bacterium]GGH75935.1 hypothetical protein GCM10011318_23480 [Phaeocystidibacter marisrubri]